MHHLPHDAQVGGDAFWLAHNGVADHVRCLGGADGRHVVVDLGGRDHRCAHQRHVDSGKADPLVGQLAGGAAGESIQCRFGGHIGGKAGCIGEHADAGNVDHMAAAVFDHAGHQLHDQSQGAEVIELHGAFVIVETVKRMDHGTANGAPGVVHQNIHMAMIGEDLLD